MSTNISYFANSIVNLGNGNRSSISPAATATAATNTTSLSPSEVINIDQDDSCNDNFQRYLDYFEEDGLDRSKNKKFKCRKCGHNVVGKQKAFSHILGPENTNQRVSLCTHLYSVDEKKKLRDERRETFPHVAAGTSNKRPASSSFSQMDVRECAKKMMKEENRATEALVIEIDKLILSPRLICT
jgi:hypothetical protein